METLCRMSCCNLDVRHTCTEKALDHHDRKGENRKYVKYYHWLYKIRATIIIGVIFGGANFRMNYRQSYNYRCESSVCCDIIVLQCLSLDAFIVSAFTK